MNLFIYLLIYLLFNHFIYFIYFIYMRAGALKNPPSLAAHP